MEQQLSLHDASTASISELKKKKSSEKREP